MLSAAKDGLRVPEIIFSETLFCSGFLKVGGLVSCLLRMCAMHQKNHAAKCSTERKYKTLLFLEHYDIQVRF